MTEQILDAKKQLEQFIEDKEQLEQIIEGFEEIEKLDENQLLKAKEINDDENLLNISIHCKV